MAAHRKSDRLRVYLCAGGLHKRDVSAQVEMNRIGPQMVVNEQ